MTISAKIILDSVGEHSPRLTTMQLRYPKFIHGEAKTHRVIRINDAWVDIMEEIGLMDDPNFSRNASSSRAIPVERLIKDVIDDPVYPAFWGKNQPGMSADEECAELVGAGWTREQAWEIARNQAVDAARAFARAGYHKQIVNRLLEPFCHINVVVTATEWSNFFALRCHPGAQPEMRILAEAMRDALRASEPNKLVSGQWHLPYLRVKDVDELADFFVGKQQGQELAYTEQCVAQIVRDIDEHVLQNLIKISVARCARVSYLTQEGKTPDVADDLKLYDRLVGSVPLHASPAEHQATPDTKISINDPHHYGIVQSWKQPHLHGNLHGWVQYRKMLPGESA